MAEDTAEQAAEWVAEEGSDGGKAGADDAEAGLYEGEHGGVGFDP